MRERSAGGGGTTQLERGQAAQPRDRGAPRARAAAEGAELVVLPGEVQRARLARAAARRRRAARRPDAALGRRRWPASSASGWSPAASSSASRATRSCATRRCCRPRRRACTRVYRKIHLFDVEVGGVDLPRVRRRGAGRRDRRCRRRRLKLGLAVCYDLRFPELFRIMAVRRRARVLAARGVHGADRQGPLGGAGARARDREPGLRDRRRPGRPPPAGPRELRPFDDRRPVGHRARSAPATSPSRCVVADLDLEAQARRAREAALAREPPPGRLPLAGARWRCAR